MTGTDITYAAELLRKGQLVAVPTETVYGLAGNALDVAAVAEIFRVKNRPVFDPLIVHLRSFEDAARFCENIPEMAKMLAETFLPGALTLLLQKKTDIPDLVTAGSPFVAIRVPRHPMARQLLHMLPFPLAAPSANPFGYISPTTAQHVATQLGDHIPYILDGGACEVGLESTIVGFPDGVPTIFRKGGIAVEAIEAVVGKVEVKPFSTSNPDAPGMLQSHYAPRIPLIISDLKNIPAQFDRQKMGILAFQKAVENIPAPHQFVLSPKGDFAEAARNLFAGMRHLDGLNLDVIAAELLPETDLGRAINDRLRRAAGKGK
jgi:L-threonylcarbamoyladenylate synthase